MLTTCFGTFVQKNYTELNLALKNLCFFIFFRQKFALDKKFWKSIECALIFFLHTSPMDHVLSFEKMQRQV